MKKILIIVLTTVLMLNMMGCTKTSNNRNEEKIGIRGLITKVLTDDNKKVTGILVEGKVESDTIHDKATVSIDKSTKISARELKEGMKVEVVFEGPVMESYPVQGKAKTIKVIE
ncbi:DUF3221 domain-containing protein [Clostridium sp. BNL1100]|uniref:DUF3221 domain-containing protein n=1 Tax=Clostridium sp. BNL1100 TaxID=755731 RepID=UPI00024A7973|nr:DUF3221 domain-containing protein [Clostridium sp. BNL1100]AEY66968.1 hypothetical protein Clo1100_2810 [Clostridium sp. BNL1100]